MKTTIAILFAAAGLTFAAGKQTFTGVITDDMCADAKHADMNMGPDPKCVVECVKQKGAYVLYDGKAAYKLSDQKTPEKFAAKKVTVTGTLDEASKTITVTSIAAAK